MTKHRHVVYRPTSEVGVGTLLAQNRDISLEEIDHPAPRRHHAHHLAKLKQIAATGGHKVRLEAVRLDAKQLLDIDGGQRECVRLPDLTARLQCSLSNVV